MPPSHLNIIGPQVGHLRQMAGLSQEALSAKCGVRGWDISRGTLAKIEAQVRCVSDAEIWILAECLDCSIESLYPNKRKIITDALRKGAN